MELKPLHTNKKWGGRREANVNIAKMSGGLLTLLFPTGIKV
jgi:hypothetical protein